MGTARLFQPFGSQGHVAKLFGNFDPRQCHCGLTNAVVVDQVSHEKDARDDYFREFHIRLPCFFTSVASSNLRYLTPREAQQKLTEDNGAVALEPPAPLPPLPRWTLLGHLTEAHRNELLQYRLETPVRPKPSDELAELSQDGSWFQLFGGVNPWSMVSGLGSCAQVTFAHAQEALKHSSLAGPDAADMTPGFPQVVAQPAFTQPPPEQGYMQQPAGQASTMQPTGPAVLQQPPGAPMHGQAINPAAAAANYYSHQGVE